ncbi:MAG TPA: phosphate ABC transporter substrate-binding protein PstS [bacterium]|nr:phosphate ABC transporter substrate-binding protein PstS [bacterium]
MKVLLKIVFLSVVLFNFTGFVLAGIEIKGAGGMAYKPLAQSWTVDYSQTKIKYDAKNAADGINEFLSKDSDFAIIDASLTAAEDKKGKSHSLLYCPVALSAEAVVYNLPGISSGTLKLTPKLLSDIFIGKIKKWNDPALRTANPKLLLPDLDIFVIHQSDESSLNDFFPAYLAKQNAQWTLKREKDKNLHWPVGQNVNGNRKVLDKLRQWAGVIVVVNYSFAREKQLPVAQIQNEAGQYVEPTLKSIELAALGHTSVKGAKAYPLTVEVMASVFQDYGKTFHQHTRGQAVVDFLNWVLSPAGQETGSKAFFVPLPESVLNQSLSKVKTIQY